MIQIIVHILFLYFIIYDLINESLIPASREHLSKVYSI